MNKTNFKIIIIFFITLLIGLVFVAIILFLPINENFKENLICEIVGAWILASSVTGFFLYLQEANEFKANKQRALSFYENELLSDLKEVRNREPSAWNLSGGNKFYFDNSRINPLFDVYKKNIKEINNFKTYFPDNQKIKTFEEFYKKARVGYVCGEKIDNLIYQEIRSFHHKNGVSSTNDMKAIGYIKGKLYSDASENELQKHLEWTSTPERMVELEKIIRKNNQILTLVKKHKKIRESLLE